MNIYRLVNIQLLNDNFLMCWNIIGWRPYIIAYDVIGPMHRQLGLRKEKTYILGLPHPLIYDKDTTASTVYSLDGDIAYTFPSTLSSVDPNFALILKVVRIYMYTFSYNYDN